MDLLLTQQGSGDHDTTQRLKNEFLLQFDGVGLIQYIHHQMLFMALFARKVHVLIINKGEEILQRFFSCRDGRAMKSKELRHLLHHSEL